VWYLHWTIYFLISDFGGCAATNCGFALRPVADCSIGSCGMFEIFAMFLEVVFDAADFFLMRGIRLLL